MFSITIPIGGALVVAGLMVLTLGPRKKRARLGVTLLAIFGVAIAEYGYLHVVSKDRNDHEALLLERTHLCNEVASDILHHQEWFLRGSYQLPIGERAAALSALEREVSNVWRICVPKESVCSAMDPAMVGDGEREKMEAIHGCFAKGPTPLESARIFLKN